MKTICFFLKTFDAEIKISRYLIASISKFCKSEYEIVVFTDTIEEEKQIRDYGENLPIRVHSMEAEHLPRNIGYLDQQCLKLSASEYTACDYILHVDSDMVFWRPFNIQDFLHQNLPLIPFADWSRNCFIHNHQVRSLQKYLNDDFFFIGKLEDYLSRLDNEQLLYLGYSEFRSDKYSNVLIGTDGTVYRWSTAYPDLLWIVSSRLIAPQTPFDTMRSHYIIDRSQLSELRNIIIQRYGSIWDLAYSRDAVPVFSEFQIIGNYILDRHYRAEKSLCFPLPYQLLYNLETFGAKIPVVKYQLKDHPISVYTSILNGDFSHLHTKSQMVNALGPQWRS